MEGLSQEYSMPLLEGDDFFKNLDGIDNDFILDAEIQDFDEEGDLDLGSEQEDEDETYIESPEYPDTPDEKLSRQEQLRMMHLRSHLNELTEKVKQHQYLTEKTRDELKQARNKINELEVERDQVRIQIQGKESDGDKSAIHRLRSQHDRLSQEIDDERKIEQLICDRLDKEEYELNKVEVERGKFLLAEDELIKKEERLAKEKTDLALKRLRKEEHNTMQAEKNRRKREKNYIEMIRERETRHRQRAEEAKHSHDKHSKFVDDTVQKMKQRQEEENVRYKENMQKKMDMLLKLKSDISANRENLKALRARDKAAEKEELKQLEETRQKIVREGGNPDEILLIQKRIDMFQKQKSQFDLQQRERQASIMEKILIEEERMKRRKKQQPLLWDDPKREKSKIVAPLKKKPLQTFETYKQMTSDLDSELTLDLGDSSDEKVEEKYDDDTEKREVDEGPGDGDCPPDTSDSSDDDHDEKAGLDLARPEFEGLWDHHKPYTVPRDMDASPLKLPGASKMEKTIMSQVLDKHRAGIVIKQVAAGREFTGCPFYSKPDVIHFKDFEVGKTYKKKVTLTNVSYTVNYCKYLDITEHLKDFISIHFDPPGQMSAGLTCEMLVTFSPMINEDLCGDVKFLSQTGPFQIPLKCTTKKCDLSVDTDMIQFGTSVIDETLKRTFTLTNKGALGTTFEFFKVTGMKAKTATSAQTSLGRMTTANESQAVTPTEPPCDDKIKKEATVTELGTEKKTSEGETALTLEEGTTEGQGQEETQEVTEEGEVENEPVSRDLQVSELEDYASLDGMKVGPIATGEIGPFSSTKLEIIWNPTIAGKVDTEFLVTFSDPLSDSIPIKSQGNAIDVPVWVARQTVDLKICMLDRLYQDTIVVNNRATTALRLKFEVCKELRDHLELLPKTGYIQAQSQFSAQLKFLPRQSLFEECGKFFDKETGVLEAPMTIRVADQTAPVPFTVNAVVTNSDMEFDCQNIDFGCCTIYESTKTTIKLTNKSILPQEYGFVGHPEYVEVQPNDGFGTLLPLETIELDVIFSPKKARDYKFELNCKSIINREFKIQCVGVGVHPPLELSHQVINFAATSLYDVSTASFHLVNSHTSMNEFTHPVPRIGKGEIAPVGPTSFEFIVPDGSPISIAPSVGTIQPGEKFRIQVRFSPQLEEGLIRQEAVRMATRQMEQQADREYKEALKRQKEAEEQQEQAVKSGKSLSKLKGRRDSKKAAPSGKKGAPPPKTPASKGKQTPGGSMTAPVSGPTPVIPPNAEDISRESPAFAAAVGSLLRQFKGKFTSFTVPCYVASGECSNPGELPYTTANTLYLEIHCPTVKPPLVVISDSGKTTTEFGEVSLGQNAFKSITIQNITKRTLELSSSALDTTGPFQVMNAFRVLPPDATHTMLVSFTPTSGRVFQEMLYIQSLTASLHITLCGRGVSPMLNITPTLPDDKVMDMGSILAGEYIEKTFKMQNTSSLSIDFAVKLESMSLLRHAHAQDLPAFIGGKPKSLVGIQNNNGSNVFDLVPCSGTIVPDGSSEITVTFAPDHPSDFFSDGIKIELFGKEESHAFKIKGTAKQRIMFIEGGDQLGPDKESLAVLPAPITDEEDARPAVTSVLVTLRSVAKEDTNVPASRDIYVGCVRTMAVSQKKNGEFSFDNVQSITSKGFNIEPQKGMVEAGLLKPITITWSPPAGHNPNEPMEGIITATLKGDIAEQFKIILRAIVVSE